MAVLKPPAHDHLTILSAPSPPLPHGMQDPAMVAANLRSLITLLTHWTHPTTFGCRAVAGHLVNLAVKRNWHSGDLEAFLQALPQHILARLCVSVVAGLPLQEQQGSVVAGTLNSMDITSSSSSDTSVGRRASSCCSHPLLDILEEQPMLANAATAPAAAVGRLEQLAAVKPVFDAREVTLQAAYEAGSMGELPGVAVADLLLLLPRDPAVAGSSEAAKPAVGGEAVGYAVTLEAAYEAGSMGELPGVAITDLLTWPARAPSGPSADLSMPSAGAVLVRTVSRRAGAAVDSTRAARMEKVGVEQGGVAMGAAYEAGAMVELPAAALCM
jgi:hypothetical protein